LTTKRLRNRFRKSTDWQMKCASRDEWKLSLGVGLTVCTLGRQLGGDCKTGPATLSWSSQLQAKLPTFGATTTQVGQPSQFRQWPCSGIRTDASASPMTGTSSRWILDAGHCPIVQMRSSSTASSKRAAVQRSAKESLPKPKTLSAITPRSMEPSDQLLSGGSTSSLCPNETIPPVLLYPSHGIR